MENVEHGIRVKFHELIRGATSCKPRIAFHGFSLPHRCVRHIVASCSRVSLFLASIICLSMLEHPLGEEGEQCQTLRHSIQASLK